MVIRFRIPAFAWAAVLFLVCSPALLPLALLAALEPMQALRSAVPFLFTYLAALLFTLHFFVLDVHRTGLTLYHINHLQWPEVISARVRRIGFLPHLEVRPRHGMRWWVPLYFTGPRDLRRLLLDVTPPESPIHRALT